MKTARALRDQVPATAQAMADGDVHLGQVEVIVESLKDLCEQVPADTRADGQTTLIEACASLDPIALGRLGRRLEELLGPRRGPSPRRGQDPRPRRRAFRGREFTLSPDPYGSGGLIRGRYDAAGYAVLTAALDALSTPGRRASPTPQRAAPRASARGRPAAGAAPV